jgi:hypothetical protein
LKITANRNGVDAIGRGSSFDRLRSVALSVARRSVAVE